MSRPAENDINLLLFSVGGVHFGIDADQAAGFSVFDGEEADDLFWFHRELNYGDIPVAYQSPTIVSVRTLNGRSYRVIIDLMEDISGFSRNDIRLFPALLEPLVLRCGIWGIVMRNGKMILLLDFQRLLREKGSEITTSD